MSKQVDHDVMRWLIETKGFDVNARNNNDETPLHLAARARNERLCQLLIDWGADVHAVCSVGWTPLYEAVAQGAGGVLVEPKLSVVRCLVEAGSDVNSAASTRSVLSRVSCWPKSDSGQIQEIIDYLKSKGATNDD